SAAGGVRHPAEQAHRIASALYSGQWPPRQQETSCVLQAEDVMGGILANRWWIVFACACGLLVGTGSVLIFSFGVFLKPVTEDLGLSRGDLSTALWSATWLTALACPVVGWLIDRWGTRRIMIPGVLAFALTVAGFGLMQAEPLFLVFLIFGLVGLAGGIQTPVPYAAVISRWFDRDRGLALGVATAGVGAGVVLIPQFAA